MHAAPTADLGESLELTDENVEMVLDEIRPYLMAGAAPLTTYYSSWPPVESCSTLINRLLTCCLSSARPHSPLACPADVTALHKAVFIQDDFKR